MIGTNMQLPIRHMLILLSLAVALASIAFGAMLVLVSPQELAWWGMLVAYALLFVIVLGLSTILATVVRVRVLKQQLPMRQFIRSFRQGMFLGVLVVAALLLSSLSYLRTWSLLLLVLSLACLELFFLLSRSRAT